INLLPPVLERLGEDGKWHSIVEDVGFPAGLPRMMTLDVTGQLCGPQCVLRLRTNMQIFWDQIFVASLIERVPATTLTDQGKIAGSFRATGLPVAAATLEAPGCALEFSPDGKQPTIYDRDRTETVAGGRITGNLTRLGTVTDLLNDRDDRFVIFGPG